MTQSKISEEKIQFFAREIARKAIEKQSFSSGKISGEQIISFHDHRQVNLFALFQVYQDLTQQLLALLGAGYQLENDEMREAVKKFQNTLSRHILLDPPAFQAILEKALYNNFKLIFHPDNTMEKFFFSSGEKTQVEMFQRYASYFSDFDFVIQSMVKYFQKNDIKSIEKQEFRRLFDKVIEIFEKKEEKPFHDFQMDLLENAFGLKEEAFIEEEKEDISFVEKEARRNIADTFNKAQKVDIYSLGNPVGNETKPLAEIRQSPPPINPVKIVETHTLVAPVSEDKPLLKETAAPIDLFSSASVLKSPEKEIQKLTEDSVRLHEKFRSENAGSPNLNETLRNESQAVIPVHKQFQFIQKIFKGNNIKFKAVMDKISESTSVETSQEILEKYVFNSPDVDRSDPVVLEFSELIRARF